MDELYFEYFPFVWRCLHRRGVDEAHVEDAAQDVFLVVHRRIEDLREDASERAWLFGIALRVAKRYLRLQGRALITRSVSFDEGAPPFVFTPAMDNPFETAAKTEARDQLYDFLGRLTEKQRLVFILVELEQMRTSEAAEALGIKINTAYSRLRVSRNHFVRYTRRCLAAGRQE